MLLPAEAELCQTLGLTEAEYFYFLDLTESKIGKRAKGYEHIPDIQNGQAFVLWLGSSGGQIFLNIVIGIAVGYIASLMAPKPRQPKTPPSLTTAGQSGNRRFAPQTGFNSFQDLAELGELIPLVFTRREDGHGGIRINTKLLWSQMRSNWSGQQLRGLFLLSKGDLETPPDFAGYAIGDTTLANYINAKLALYNKLGGGRILDTDRYSEGSLANDPDDFADVFSVYWDRDGKPMPHVFSGTRTPGTQTQFGAFSPMANSMRFMVPYELVLKSKDLEQSNKDDIDKKRTKIETAFPRYSAITYAYGLPSEEDNSRITYVNTKGEVFPVTKGYQVKYVISDQNPAEQEHFDDEFNPWGMEDVKSSVDADRINGDNNLALGDSYLIGSALAVCKNIDYGRQPTTNIWIPDTGTRVEAFFDITDAGSINANGPDAIELAHQPYELTTIQRAAVGTVSTNTKCQVTEIGLKSTVWRQITGFSNVNSHPGHITYDQPGTVKDYEDDNGNIQLGQMSKYIKRYSFFRLQGRIAGKHPVEEWEYIDGDIPFAVRGNAPQPQYNFIRINHSDAYQYEFRFMPYPGNLIQRKLRDNAVTTIRLFQKESLSKVENASDIFDVYYSGNLFVLTGNAASNPEWYLGELPEMNSENSGVLALNVYDNGNGIPVSRGWVLVEEKNYSGDYDDGVSSGAYFNRPYKKKAGRNGYNINLHMYFGGQKIGQINKHYAGSRINRWSSDNLWPRNISDILGNETWSIDKDGYQYRTGTINSGDGDFWENSMEERFSVKKYAWDMVSDSHTEHDITPTTVTGIGTGCKFKVRVYANQPQSVTWEIIEIGENYRSGDKVKFTVPTKSYDIEVIVITDSGALVTDDPWPVGRNLNPYDAIADFVRYDAEQSSHLNEPEHSIVYVNEQHKSTDIDYTGLAYAGLRINSSKEWTSFSQFSAYLMRGIKMERLIYLPENEVNEATNLFPEIAYALLTDPEIGAGDLIGTQAVDKDRMTIAAKFCEANGFYWDGVITEGQNLREFIFEMAGYCFLDFTILGGKFSLMPSVPYDSNFVIKNSASFSDPDGTSNLKIKALFTDGNIKNLKVSFLSAEERQIFQARALYRRETANGFPERKVLNLRLAHEQSNSDYMGGSEQDPKETFDLTDFCTSETHAETFLKYALRVRQLVDHGVTFETTPQAAMFLAPGEYFRLYSESTHTSRFENGSISSDGTVQSIGEDILTDVEIYYWRPGVDPTTDKVMDEVAEAKLTVVDGKTTDANLFNSVFTVKQTNKSDRVYKVESLSYGEEGLIEIAGSHVPLTNSGSLAILEWTASDFT